MLKVFRTKRVNYAVLLVAVMTFIAANGVALSEHICSSTHAHNITLFFKAGCDMEKPVSKCCGAKSPKNNCCKHNQYFSKLKTDGFTVTQLEINPYRIVLLLVFYVENTSISNIASNSLFFGLPPPDNISKIEGKLQPTPAELQVYRC